MYNVMGWHFRQKLKIIYMRTGQDFITTGQDFHDDIAGQDFIMNAWDFRDGPSRFYYEKLTFSRW